MLTDINFYYKTKSSHFFPYSQLPSPVIGLQPVLGNHVVCVRFVDPSYDKEFPARRLEGAVQPPRVLKPGNLGHEENRNWRPQIGEFGVFFFHVGPKLA